MLKIVALISGGGTILEALLKACQDADFPAEIVAVGSDTEAPGLVHAKKRSIPTFIVRPQNYSSRDMWGSALHEEITRFGVGGKETPGLIISAGLMRILPRNFVAETAPFLINTHPSLLPSFPGAHAVRDAIQAGVSKTGVTVHVIDEGVDTGPIIKQATVVVAGDETEEQLHEKIKQAERPLLVQVVHDIATKKIDLKNLKSKEI